MEKMVIFSYRDSWQKKASEPKQFMQTTFRVHLWPWRWTISGDHWVDDAERMKAKQQWARETYDCDHLDCGR